MSTFTKISSTLLCITILSACGNTAVSSQNQNLNSTTSTGTLLNVTTEVAANVNTNTSVPKKSEFIKNLSLQPEQAIESPLVITGEAKGYFFEGSFPVEVQDANGKVLAMFPAQAKGDWMSDAFVPFTATLTFPLSSTATGKVVLKKDNPSALPQFDMSYVIPVKFVKNK